MITLMPVSKIQNSHYERTAYVYVRQSTPLQVAEHIESKERQYQLRQHAIDLGWSPSRVEVIDEDQGRSGRSAIHRTGFQRLASDSSLDKRACKKGELAQGLGNVRQIPRDVKPIPRGSVSSLWSQPRCSL